MARTIGTDHTDIFISTVITDKFPEWHRTSYGPYTLGTPAKQKASQETNRSNKWGSDAARGTYYYVLKQLKAVLDDNGEPKLEWVIVFDSRKDKK